MVDGLITPGATGPWVDLVLDQVELSKWLHQGDLLVDIKIPVFKALLDVQDDPMPEIPVDVGTIVVMTQNCDLENRKAPMVACCPVHTLDEFESFNERFKRKGEWENVRRGKFIKNVGHHPRLKSSYVEHMSQAFARLFKRVGLPVDIPPFK